jgi:Fungal specific transcription factor domain
VHSLTGLAIGLAFRIGLHRDAEAMGVSPFEVEMRRRLWWQICILDVHTAEEHGCDPCILESSFNTKLPLNIADSSLDPHMSKFPQSMPGKSEMLFSLLQVEVSYFARQLLFSKEFVRANAYTSMSGTEKCDAIDFFQKRIENQYLSYCDTKIAFDFVTANFTRFILVKLKLSVSQVHNQHDHSRMKQNLKEICIQILDYSSTIRNCESGQK